MESLLQDAQVAARLALQLVVTVVQFHHPRTHRLEQAVVERLQALGTARARPEWRQVIAAWEVFSRELGRHMNEEQDLILDPLQFLMVRQRLVDGALSDAREPFEALMLERERQRVLRRRLELELTHTVALQHDHPEATAVRQAIRELLTASDEHHDFEQHALVPALERFLRDEADTRPRPRPACMG